MAEASTRFGAVSTTYARCRFLFFVFILFLATAHLSEGATRYVDHSAAAGADDGSSWLNAHTTLQGALAVVASGDVLWVAEGTYPAVASGDFTISEDLHLYGGFATGGQADPDDRDISSHPTVLTNANGINGSVVIVLADAEVLLDGVTITGGNPLLGGGGVYNAGLLTVRNCTLSSNTAGAGGGGIFNALPGSHLTVENSTFSNNTAVAGGGGICNAAQASLTVENCTFSNNSAAGGGGGIFNFGNTSLVVRKSTFSQNVALSVGGGGIYNSLNASLTVENSTFSGNSVFAIGGGGIYSAGAPIVLVNCTFSDNTATEGAKGLLYTFNTTQAFVRNCIFWGGTDQIMYVPPGNIDLAYSVVDGGFAGIGNIAVNPNLAPLADNGGATRTHALPAGSLAIDQGQPVGTVVSGGVAVPSTDQRGVARPQGASVDIGAYERVVTPSPTPDPDPDPTPEPDPTPSPTPRPTPYPVQPVPHPRLFFSKTTASESFVLTNPTPLTVTLPPNPTRESMKVAIRNALRVVLGFPDELAEDFAENSFDKVDDAGQPYMSERVRERLKELLPDLEITPGTPSPPLALFLARLNSSSSVKTAEDNGAIAIAFFGPVPSVFVGKNAERLRVVKALNSASVTPFVQAFSWDALTDGCSSVVEVERVAGGGVLKRVLGRNDAITKNCLVVIAVRDGGAFDLDGTENGKVSDPAFLLEAEPSSVPSPSPDDPVPVQGGGGGCSAGGMHLFSVCILLLPLLALIVPSLRS